MTKQSALNKLKKNGYHVVVAMNSGNVIATKGNNKYTASSINGLIKKLF